MCPTSIPVVAGRQQTDVYTLRDQICLAFYIPLPFPKRKGWDQLKHCFLLKLQAQLVPEIWIFYRFEDSVVSYVHGLSLQI